MFEINGGIWDPVVVVGTKKGQGLVHVHWYTYHPMVPLHRSFLDYPIRECYPRPVRWRFDDVLYDWTFLPGPVLDVGIDLLLRPMSLLPFEINCKHVPCGWGSGSVMDLDRGD